MADKETAAVATAEDDGRKLYLVKPGVEWVDGERLRGKTEIRLTKTEAAFDLGLERIMLQGGKRPKSWAAPTKTAGKAE